ncbi:MAG: AAA family ATPase [Patescibacteria group bacterium]
MKQETLSYVQNQLVRAEARLLGYTVDTKGNPNPARHILKKIEKRINDFRLGTGEERWVIMPGLRGVGKTTVLAQTYMELRKRYGSNRVLYLSLDDVTNVMGLSLKEVLSAYEQILGTAFEKQKEPYFLLLDEVQADPAWASILKSMYDRSKRVFIFCTGSSAVSLQTNADVIRRATFEKLFPVSFGEFQMIKNHIFPVSGLKEEIKKAVYFSESLAESLQQLKKLEKKVIDYWSRVDRLEVDNYLAIGTLPLALHSKDIIQVYDAINQLLDKIISIDIRSLSRFDTDTLNNIKRLLFLVADSDVLSIHKLTQLLQMNHVTLSAVFEVLGLAELLIKVAPYGSNTSKVKKPSKFLFMSPAIRAALLSIGAADGTLATRKGHLLEDIVALHLYREFVSPGFASLSYDVSKDSADFILQTKDSRMIAIEVGMGNKGISQVQNTIENKQCNSGIVISSHSLGISDDAKILLLPLDYFLLM